MGGDWLDDWMQAVTDLDGNALHAGLRTSWNRLGGLAFLEKRIGPFLARIGHAWRNDEIGIVHEHYTSEQLQDFLSARWRPLSERSAGPTAICATLPGEDHVIGLHIAALVLAMADWQLVFLGARTPVSEIVQASQMDRVDAVVISFSERFGLEHARRSLTELRDSISGDIEVLAGGGGAPTDLPDTPSFSTLEPFYRWALQRAQARK
jgi:methylmalonyl-CoA mutase cobalamin-binding subunit